MKGLAANVSTVLWTWQFSTDQWWPNLAVPASMLQRLPAVLTATQPASTVTPVLILAPAEPSLMMPDTPSLASFGRRNLFTLVPPSREAGQPRLSCPEEE